MKLHLKHLLMCAPMFAIAAVLIVTTGSTAVILPAIGCALMMGAMMAGMALMARGHR